MLNAKSVFCNLLSEYKTCPISLIILYPTINLFDIIFNCPEFGFGNTSILEYAISSFLVKSKLQFPQFSLFYSV